MDLASPAVSGTSVYANGLTHKTTICFPFYEGMLDKMQFSSLTIRSTDTTQHTQAKWSVRAVLLPVSTYGGYGC